MKSSKLLKNSLITIGTIYLVVLISYVLPVILGWENALKWNEIGDSFGILNTLFSALAFAFIIYTSIIQKEELENQRKELELQREELKLTREEMTKSSEAQSKLAKLTHDQFNLESRKRVNDIKPGIRRTKNTGVGTSGKFHTVSIQFQAIQNSFFIISISTEDDSKVQIEHTESWLREKLYGKLFEPESFFNIHFGLNIEWVGDCKVFMSISDIDNNIYQVEMVFKKRKGKSSDFSVLSMEPVL